MKISSQSAALTMAATFALLVAGTAFALLVAGTATAGTELSQAQQQYQQERAVCLSGKSNQDRATCLQEAGAALGEARRNNLGTANAGEMGRNRMLRCDALPAGDREDCARRMQGDGVTTGSVQQGGLLRELSRPVAPGQ